MDLKDTVFYRIYYNDDNQDWYTEPCSSYNEANQLKNNIQVNKPNAYDINIVKETIIREIILG